MAAILNGFLPARRKDQFAQQRILNTRWGDAAISAPMHGSWNPQPVTNTQPEPSPELDRDLPATPPQSQNEKDGVFIVNDDESIGGSEDYDDETSGTDRDNFTITIPLPWKKKSKASSHERKPSGNGVLGTRFAPPRRVDVASPPPLATLEAAAIPLPESRISSPVGRSAATSPVLSFRSRLASPNLGDILSPVAEGFAKSGPSARPMPVLSSSQYDQITPLDRPPSASSVRSGLPRRPSLNSRNSEGIGASTMSSQASGDAQAPDMYRPPSRGIGSTAHMRASSRGPRANSRGPRTSSVEPADHRPLSAEPDSMTENVASMKPLVHPVLGFEPLRRRAPSVEPVGRRAPSVEPIRRRAPSVEPISIRANSVGPLRHRAPSPQPMSDLPLRPRASSPVPASARAPSVGPPIMKRRAMSREPRGRRGQSVEPRPRVRFHSEAGHRHRRRNSSSSNDGSVDSGENDDSADAEPMTIVDRFERDYNTSRRPRRRRSIASPITSPVAAGFGSIITTEPSQQTSFESITNRAGLAPIIQPVAERNHSRNRSKSRTRGLYADMQDDFRLLGRDVSSASTSADPSVASPRPSLGAAPASQIVINPILQRKAPPALSSHPPEPLGPGNIPPSAIHVASECQECSSNLSIAGLPSVSHHRDQSLSNSGAAVAQERRDHLRREERERAREKVARRLERERERVMTINAFSDCESIASDSLSGTERTRRVYGSGIDSDSDYGSMVQRIMPGSKKTLVPNAEEIWG